MKKKFFLHAVIFLFIILITGCTSLMEKAGQLLDGTLLEAKKLAEYKESENDRFVLKHMRGKDGQEYFLITDSRMPALSMKTSMPDSSGRLYLTSYTFLCGSVSGWNEFTMDISASGTIENNGDNLSLHINAPIELIHISSGKIRYNDERLIDDSAVRSLNNRRERILALVEWMKMQQDAPSFTSEKDFQSYWQPLILPESVSAKKRPSAWSKEDELWNRGEDINWNVSYTQKIFPEELHVYRNSGALLRDWEESFSWIFLEYTWNDLCNQLSETIRLTKLK